MGLDTTIYRISDPVDDGNEILEKLYLRKAHWLQEFMTEFLGFCVEHTIGGNDGRVLLSESQVDEIYKRVAVLAVGEWQRGQLDELVGFLGGGSGFGDVVVYEEH